MQVLPPLWHEHYSATSLRAPKEASKRGKGKGCSLVGVPALTELCAHGTTAPILALTHATKNALKVTTGMLRFFLKFISNHILTWAFHGFVTFHLGRIKVQQYVSATGVLKQTLGGEELTHQRLCPCSREETVPTILIYRLLASSAMVGALI